MIYDLLFNKFLSKLSNISSFSVTRRLQRFENLQVLISKEKRLSSLSSPKEFFEEIAPYYEQHLLNCRYKEKLSDVTSQNLTRETINVSTIVVIHYFS